MRALTDRQIEAIREAMRLFVEEDLSKGIAPSQKRYCGRCQQVRAAPGFVHYDDYLLCNECAIEYEIALCRGLVSTIGEFVST